MNLAKNPNLLLTRSAAEFVKKGQRLTDGEGAISHDLREAAIVSHQMGRFAVECAEHECGVVRIARVAAEVKRLDFYPLASAEKRTDDQPDGCAVHAFLDQFLNVFEEDVVRIEEREST